MGRASLKLLTTFCVLFLLSSCSKTPYRDDKSPSSAPIQGRPGPLTVVVLPFENLTSEPELENLVRRSFYSHFTPKEYRDIELNDVDRALEILRNTSSKTWKDLPPTGLAEFFRADFLIYGKVLEYNKVFAGIYSQIALKVQLEMVDGKTGEGVWWKTVIQRSHEGGVPFSLFGIIPETLRAGLHMQKERTLDLIERVSRELVEAIPDGPVAKASSFFLDVQAASFLEEGLALKAQQELQDKGYPARVEAVAMGDRTWHRVLLGPYQEAGEATQVKASLSQDPKFKPILIHHSLGSRDRARSPTQ